MARLIDSAPGCPTPTPLRGASAAEERGLSYDAAVKKETDHLYPLVADFVTPMEWPAVAPLVAAINRLKKKKNAVILAHNYMTPDIFSLVGDFRGDSLQLAREASAVDADQRKVSELSRRHLCELHRRREGRVPHYLHQLECVTGCRAYREGMEFRHRHHGARPVSCEKRGRPDRYSHHDMAGCLRSARAVLSR